MIESYLNDDLRSHRKPLCVGLAIERAVDFLAEPERLVFGGDLEDAAAGQVHLVKRLHGGQTGSAALVGVAHLRSVAVSGLRHCA